MAILKLTWLPWQPDNATSSGCPLVFKTRPIMFWSMPNQPYVGRIALCTRKKWRNKALLRYSVQCTQYTLSICTLYTFSAYMFKITMTLVCTISIGKVFNRVLNFISVLSVLIYNSVLMCNNVLMSNNVLIMYNSVLMYGSVITNPGQNATNQTRTECHKTKTGQNATE